MVEFDGDAGGEVVADFDGDRSAVGEGVGGVDGDVGAVDPEVDADVLAGGAVVVGVEADGEVLVGGGSGFAPGSGAEVADGEADAIGGGDLAVGSDVEVEACGEAVEGGGGLQVVEDDGAHLAADGFGEDDLAVAPGGAAEEGGVAGTGGEVAGEGREGFNADAGEAASAGGGIGDGDAFPLGVDGLEGGGGKVEGAPVLEISGDIDVVADAGVGRGFATDEGDGELRGGIDGDAWEACVSAGGEGAEGGVEEVSCGGGEVEGVFEEACHAVAGGVAEVLGAIGGEAMDGAPVFQAVAEGVGGAAFRGGQPAAAVGNRADGGGGVEGEGRGVEGAVGCRGLAAIGGVADGCALGGRWQCDDEAAGVGAGGRKDGGEGRGGNFLKGDGVEDGVHIGGGGSDVGSVEGEGDVGAGGGEFMDDRAGGVAAHRDALEGGWIDVVGNEGAVDEDVEAAVVVSAFGDDDLHFVTAAGDGVGELDEDGLAGEAPADGLDHTVEDVFGRGVSKVAADPVGDLVGGGNADAGGGIGGELGIADGAGGAIGADVDGVGEISTEVEAIGGAGAEDAGEVGDAGFVRGNEGVAGRCMRGFGRRSRRSAKGTRRCSVMVGSTSR